MSLVFSMDKMVGKDFDPFDLVCHVAFGRPPLTRKERAVLYCLRETQNELNGRNVPTLMLYGRVVEKVDMSQAEFQAILTRMVGLHGYPKSVR